VQDTSFEEFVRSQLPTLGRHACALTGDARAAEDLVVATLATLARWSRHTPIAELRPLSMATLYRTYVGRYPVPGRARDALCRAKQWLRHTDATPFQEAIARLPRDQRAVLVGTYVADASDVELAELIGRTPVAVRSLRYRALRALRAAQAAMPVVDAPQENADAWITRDTWTQETVHLPGTLTLPLPPPPRTAAPARATAPARPGSAHTAKSPRVASAARGNSGRNSAGVARTNASRASVARGNAARSLTTRNTEVRRAGR
jgi:DNA-directed RNA polymerase specialized sigma24 family protein